MYHAMGYSSILVMQAGMTFDPKDMDAAMTSLGESLQTCQRSFLFVLFVVTVHFHRFNKNLNIAWKLQLFVYCFQKS